MTTVFVKSGDVTRDVQVDALATLINSGGAWFGGVDGAIMRVAGPLFHSQAMAVSLKDGDVVIAKQGLHSHSGSFKDVIFVVDDLKQPLSDLVFLALQAARSQKYTTVAFPLMRTGVMLGVVESGIKEVVNQIKAGIDKYINSADWNLQIYIVVYNDPYAEELLLKDGSMKKL